MHVCLRRLTRAVVCRPLSRAQRRVGCLIRRSCRPDSEAVVSGTCTFYVGMLPGLDVRSTCIASAEDIDLGARCTHEDNLHLYWA